MAKILISGGSGLVGKSLVALLKNQHHQVYVLTHRKELAQNSNWIYWDPEYEIIDTELLHNIDVVIHLAGANIGSKRWTRTRKKIIRDSRIRSCEFLFKLFSTLDKQPGVFISASAVGFYGSTTSEKIYTELDPAAQDFLGKVCDDWERAADKFNSLGSRVVKIRTGVVLSEEGSALQQMILSLRFGLNAILGKGNQYFPWIHIDDLCNIYAKAVNDSNMRGAYNAVSSDISTNEKLMNVVCEVLNKKTLKIKILKVVVKLLFGEMAVILLEGSRVSNQKLLDASFELKYPALPVALRNLLLKEK